MVSGGHVFTTQLYTSGWACMRRGREGGDREGGKGVGWEGREGGMGEIHGWEGGEESGRMIRW